MSDIDARIAKLTKRQADGLLYACLPKFAPEVPHTEREFWDRGYGVGASVLDALVRANLVQKFAGRPRMWRPTALGREVAARLSETADA